MDRKDFYSNLGRFSKILQNNGTDLQSFFFHSSVYIEGIRQSISEVERFCTVGARILDLGCGTGFLSMVLGDLGFRVDGIDVKINNPEMIEEFQNRKGLQGKIWRALENSNHNIKFHFYNGIEFPFGNQSFDAVIAHAVIEHIPSQNLGSIFQKIRRVLKQGGYLLIFRTPRKEAYAESVVRILRIGSHNVLMDEHKITSILKINGFKVICLRRTDMIFGALPDKLQYMWNFFSPILLMLDKFLLKTPISHFAHHMEIICIKSKDTIKKYKTNTN